MSTIDGVAVLVTVLVVGGVVYVARRWRAAGRLLEHLLEGRPGRHAQGAAMDSGYGMSPAAYRSAGSMSLAHEWGLPPAPQLGHAELPTTLDLFNRARPYFTTTPATRVEFGPGGLAFVEPDGTRILAVPAVDLAGPADDHERTTRLLNALAWDPERKLP